MTIFRIDADTLTRAANGHLVQRGDTFSKIAQQHYHNMKMWPVLWAYNQRENPHVLREGERIFIPRIMRGEVPQELIFLV